VAGTVAGCRSLHCTAVGDVAADNCLLQRLGDCSRSRIAVLDDHAGIADKADHWYHSMTERGHGFDRCRMRAVGNGAEANGCNLADLEMSTGRTVEGVGWPVAVAGRMMAVAVDSSPDLRHGCSHSCCLQLCRFGVDIVSYLARLAGGPSVCFGEER
jgi:hypothetical protein